ncbi:hypothetical protein KRR40_04785 [Niabella defluvii]|nr:hypothetical protein KRR40_04785 [Niabella sp. I65]
MYMDEVWERYATGQLYYADSNKISNGKVYKTNGGRTVYGGGGIMPDVFVGLDTSNYSREINMLFLNGSFNDFVFHYYLDNKKYWTLILTRRFIPKTLIPPEICGLSSPTG